MKQELKISEYAKKVHCTVRTVWNRINADLNGALNIIRKAVPNAFAEGIEAVVVPTTRTLVA